MTVVIETYSMSQ